MIDISEDKIWKKFYRIRFWIGLFLGIPLLTWGIVFGLTNSYDISNIFAVVFFLIYLFVFLYLRIYKDF